MTATDILAIVQRRDPDEMASTEAYRFWSKVFPSDDGCWIWRGAKQRRGYGFFTYRGKKGVGAHRVAYQMCVDDIPDGMYVCHKCDTPSCVNPFHLFLGTARDNARDRDSKGRAASRSGECNGQSKISRDDVAEIRSRLAKRVRGQQVIVAREFGISTTQVSRIVRGRRWKESNSKSE